MLIFTEKVLNELMSDVCNRIDNVRLLVNDIKPTLQYQIVPIDDVYGPAGTDGSIECIVVSQETIGGAGAINVRRTEQVPNSFSAKTDVFTLLYSHPMLTSNAGFAETIKVK